MPDTAPPRTARDRLAALVEELLRQGTARAAIPIAQAGHRVVGIDYDQAMLNIARTFAPFDVALVGINQLIDSGTAIGAALRLSARRCPDGRCHEHGG